MSEKPLIVNLCNIIRNSKHWAPRLAVEEGLRLRKTWYILQMLTLLSAFVTGVLQRQADGTVMSRTIFPVRDDLSGWRTMSHCRETGKDAIEVWIMFMNQKYGMVNIRHNNDPLLFSFSAFHRVAAITYCKMQKAKAVFFPASNN